MRSRALTIGAPIALSLKDIIKDFRTAIAFDRGSGFTDNFLGFPILRHTFAKDTIQAPISVTDQ
jgi:hypothetical protein